MIPSDEALRRHRKRACWVLSVYEQCTQNNIRYPPLVGNGWNLSNSNLTIDWDSEDKYQKRRYKTFVGTLHCSLENGADLYVNKRQKIRHYRARSTEERRRKKM